MKIEKILIGILVLMAMAMPVMAGNAQPGKVMACDSTGDDINLYPGTDIYIKGDITDKPPPNVAFSWEIYDMEAGCPGGSIPGIGCGTRVSSGAGGSTDANGDIWPPYPTGWSIPEPDHAGHKYKLIVTFGPTNDPHFANFYTKVDSFEPIPELATIALTSAGLLGIFLISRRDRK